VIDNNFTFEEMVNRFQRTIKRRLTIELSNKLLGWSNLSFLEFIKELKKKKIKFGLSEETEWEDYFETEKSKAQIVKSEINQIEQQIDQLVYQLYDLTPEEIAIIEESTT